MGRSDKKKTSKRRRSEEKSKKHSKKRKREKERGRDGDKRKKSGGQDCHRDDVVTSDSGSPQVASPPRPSRNPIDSRTPPASPEKPNHPSSHPSNHPSVAIGPQFPPSLSASEFSDRPPPAAEIGPQFPPPEDNGVEAIPNSPPRVARGPQRPPQSILDAAQVLQEEPMVGPLPPDIQEEAEYFSDDVRSKEVDRVMGVSGDSEGEFVDAFKVLGVEEGAGDSEVKKKYWRLSLMVHPDKCPHPKAQQAFQAVNAAFKKLGSAAGRASVRSEKEDAQLRQQAQEEAEQMLRQQQWDVVRSGGALADMKKAGPPTRETWMTELPPERQKPKIASQVSVTSFSQRGIQSRGDTSAWTSTPTQPSQKPTIAYKTSAKSIESGGGQNAPASGGGGGGVAGGGGGGIVRKSLVEMHLEKLKKEKKLKKKQRKEEEKKGGAGGFKGWRPFDREKDLQIPRDNAKSLDQVMKDAQSLSRRFG